MTSKIHALVDSNRLPVRLALRLRTFDLPENAVSPKIRVNATRRPWLRLVRSLPHVVDPSVDAAVQGALCERSSPGELGISRRSTYDGVRSTPSRGAHRTSRRAFVARTSLTAWSRIPTLRSSGAMRRARASFAPRWPFRANMRSGAGRLSGKLRSRDMQRIFWKRALLRVLDRPSSSPDCLLARGR